MARYSIPPEFYSSLLPAADLTVLQLVQFHLPLVLLSFPLTTTKDFFDPLPASPVDITAIQDIPSPPHPVVQALQKDLEIAVGNGHHSIRCIHAPSASERTYPLWIITNGKQRESQSHSGLSTNALQRYQFSAGVINLYTSDKWLKGAHANQMLDLLQRDLQRKAKHHINLGSSYFPLQIPSGSIDTLGTIWWGSNSTDAFLSHFNRIPFPVASWPGMH